MTGWYFVYKDDEDGEIKATKGTSNMPVDHPELNDVWKIATKAEDEETAIKKAIELDNEGDENDKILS